MAAVPLPEPNFSEYPSLDFGFAFNDVNFSDRIMTIEILPDLPGPELDSDDNCARSRKRSRVDPVSNANELAEQSKEPISNSNMPDLKDGITYENQEEAVAVIEESSVGGEVTVNQPSQTKTCFLEATAHEVAKDNEPSSSRKCSGTKVRTLHVSSPILASNSPFFYKLFSNGMRESEQHHVNLQIQASEEDALIDMLSYMYNRTLPRTTPTALLGVLMAADKFEVTSCMRYCSRLLCTLPMTCESALLYLDLPSSVLMADAVQQLRYAAKKFLAHHFKDIKKYKEEVLKLPLAGFEAVLSSDDLRVSCEDDIYKLVLKWARLHYPKLEERREMLSKHILQFVRFPSMSITFLHKVLTCRAIKSEVACKVVADALLFKAGSPHRQRSLVAEDANASFRQFVERSYILHPVKVFESEWPCQKCIAYVDLKREECAQLFPCGRIYMQPFHLGEQVFTLSVCCSMDEEQHYRCFGLFLSRNERDTGGLMVRFEFSAGMKHAKHFVSKGKDKGMFVKGEEYEYPDIFLMPWAEFMADDSPYFINGVLHLKMKLTLDK